MSSVKKAVICSFCIALCFVLPVVFHAAGLGNVFSPMHIPVLLCGLVCGWPYGAFCGVAGPVLSSFSGMPSAMQLIYFIPELAAYGFFSGFLFSRVRTRRFIADVYLSLLPAMLAGRVLGGAAQAAFYLSTDRGWSPALWAAGYLAGTAPGMAVQLVLLPALLLALSRARVIPARYPKEGGNVNGAKA